MFLPDASIVLLGVRGSGKTTLAIIAQASLGLQHIDTDDAFHKETGVSPAQYRKENGAQQSRAKWLSFLTTLLSTFSKKCVIVWPKDYVEEAGLSLLKQYGREHLVILVQRNTSAISRYLHLSESTKIEKLVKIIVPTYRACSNYEYFNLDETGSPNWKEPSILDLSNDALDYNHQSPRSLRLKHVEKSFLRLIKHTLRPSLPVNEQTPPRAILDSRASYTYLLNVSLAQLSSENFNIRWLNSGADAIQLEIESGASGQPVSPETIKEQISSVFATVSRMSDRPIIYHVRPTTADLSGNSRSLYLDLLDHGFRIGVELATIQLELPLPVIKEQIMSARGARLIGDHHDKTPEAHAWLSSERRNLVTKAASLGLDGIRLTQAARSQTDNKEVAAFAVSVKRDMLSKPFVIAYNTGLLGRTSRCWNEILTSVTTKELRHHFSTAGTDQNLSSEITIQESQNSLYASFIYDPMKYYVIGHDVSFSYSPVIHNAAHEFFGMPHQLQIRSMPSLDRLSELTDDEHFGGFSIAQGFKMAMIARVSGISVHARSIGAINTLLPVRTAFDYTKPPPPEFWANRNRAGPVLAFYGDNFDWVGMTRCIQRNLSPANVITPNTTALVIGAGGMARAAIYALLKLGVRHVVLYNRTYMHARALADHFSDLDLDPSPDKEAQNGTNSDSMIRSDIRVLSSLNADWYGDLEPPKMILSCVPAASSRGSPDDKFLLSPSWMKSPTGGVVIDMDYRTLITPLLRQVRGQAQYGWVAVDGLENLVDQACAQFEVFTCRRVPKNLMCVAALQHYLKSSREDAEVCRYVEGQLRRILSSI